MASSDLAFPDAESAGGFSLLHFAAGAGDPTIFVEMDAGGIYPDRPTDIARYEWIFGRLCELALSPDESIALVTRLAAGLTTQGD